MGFSLVNHPFEGTPIYGSLHMDKLLIHQQFFKSWLRHMQLGCSQTDFAFDPNKKYECNQKGIDMGLAKNEVDPKMPFAWGTLR